MWLFLTVGLADAAHGPPPQSSPAPAHSPGWTWREQAQPEPKEAVRLIILGDAGDGKAPAPVVVSAARSACANGCDGVVLLGDNRYPAGIHNDATRRWAAGWVDAWGADEPAIQPVYWVLGNHDWEPGLALLGRAQQELTWVRTRPDVVGDSHFWTVDLGVVRLVAWDTNAMVRDPSWDRELRACGTVPSPVCAMVDAVSAPGGGWTVGLGHHPVVSAGSHGNAGTFRDIGLHLWPGSGLAHTLRSKLHGTFDLWLAGHDHNLQLWPDPVGGDGAAAVVGAGSKVSPFRRAPPAGWDDRIGFGVLEATATNLSLTLFDVGGDRLGSMSRTSGETWRLDP